MRLPTSLDGEIAHAGEIAAGSGPALHELDVERIAAEAEHDGLCDLERAQPAPSQAMRRTRWRCCARAPSGHAAAAPPSVRMNSRRRM
jgi:hypothetical protein